MSTTPVSHNVWAIHAWPEQAIEPTILYLHVGGDIPAAAANTAAGWQIVVFGADCENLLVEDGAEAVRWLEAFAHRAAA